MVYELLAIANWLVAAALTGFLAPMVAEWVPFLAGSGMLAIAVRYVVVFVVPFLRDFFRLEPFWDEAWIYSALAVGVAGTLIIVIGRTMPRR